MKHGILGRHLTGLVLAGVLVLAVPSSAQECKFVGGCTGDLPAGMCGTATDPIEEGTGCNGVLNCQEPEFTNGPTVEVEALPVEEDKAPLFRVSLVASVKTPYNIWARENNPNGQLVAFWSRGGRVSVCHSTLSDMSKVWLSTTMTCGQMRSARSAGGNNPSGEKISLVVASCGPACNPEQPGCFTHECHKWVEKKDLSLQVPDETVESLCPVKDNPCGAGGGCSSSFQYSPPGSGPGATLSYRPGGVGRHSPGSVAWNEELGRFWSHTYAERLVLDGEDHAYLITGDATYRELWDVEGDGVLEKTSPTDYRASLVKTPSGWELRALDGTVKEFDGAGRWLASRDRYGFGPAGTYADGKLTEVSFPDARQEVFTYHADGKLASIAEVGVDEVTYRTWYYTWDDLDLVRIDRPDATAWLFRYEDPRHPGYMTRATLVGTDESERIDRIWQFDDFGNVVQTWRGTESPTSDDAVGLESYVYEEPWNPVETRRTDPLDNLSVYAFDRDADSNTPLPRSSMGDCGSCGAGPNTQQSYDDPSNPTRVTRSVDARGTVTLFEYNGTGQMTSRTEAFMTELERTTTWKYEDPRHPTLVTAIEVPSTSGSGVRRTSWTYDSAGNVTHQSQEGVENGSAFRWETVLSYNSACRPESINPPGYGTQDQTLLAYDSSRGNLIVTSRTDPIVDGNATVTRYTYSDRDLLTEQVSEASGRKSFLYNEHGQPVRETDARGVIVETTVDAADRVVFADYGENDLDVFYVYDDPSVPFSRGRLTAITRAGGTTLSPVLGRPVANWVTRATYSSEGTLHHREIERSAMPGSPRNTPHTVGADYVFYLAERPVAQLLKPEDIPPEGLPTAASTLLFFTTDHLGAPILVTDGSGQVVWEGGFQPFGRDDSGAQESGVFLRFPGQWTDETWAELGLDEGLYYNVNRWYESTTGSYSRTDPLGVVDTNLFSPRTALDTEPIRQLYSYAAMNPIVLLDPLGLKARVCCRKIPKIGKLIKRARHCFIQIQVDGKSTTCGLIGGIFSGQKKGIGNIYRDNGFDDPGMSQCGPWTDNCNVDQCVIDTAQNYGNPSKYHFARGPNSNTFAGSIARACGLTKPDVGKDPGWGKADAPARKKQNAKPVECALP